MHNTWGRVQAPEEGTGTTATGAPVQLALDLEGVAEGPRTQCVRDYRNQKSHHFLIGQKGKKKEGTDMVASQKGRSDLGQLEHTGKGQIRHK